MSSRPTDPLLLAGKVLTLIIQAATAIGAAAVAIALPVAPLARAGYLTQFVNTGGAPIETLPVLALTGLLLIALVIMAALFIFFGRLRAIIDTVGEGDPFTPENAQRLDLMAWLLLTSQVLSWPLVALALVIAEWAQELDNVDLRLEGDAFDVTGILMVLILFILARVFRHGAAMREDLEGTV